MSPRRPLLLLLLALLASAGAAPAQAGDDRPTLYYIGDSTVRNGSGNGGNGQWGWGDHTAAYFDTTRVRIANRALGGRSSRTFLTQGHWERVLETLKSGDVVIIQFGHNDGGALNDTSRARGTIRGVGDESEEIDNLLTGEHEVVHSFGWYLRRYVADTRARGATPVIASLVPRNRLDDSGRFIRDADSYAGWAQEVARAEGVPFIDLNELVAAEYDRLGAERVAPLFQGDHTHTSLEGAQLSARVVVGALKTLPENPVEAYLSEQGRSASGRPLRIIAFGAHPDDNELKAAGVAAMWAAAGHAVKFVAMTNGDVGHFGMAGGPLAQRRRAEVEECARILGIETQVLDIHDGELMPTLENRRTVARLIRDWQADIVLAHRPWDYHADHRYTGVLVNDAAVIVGAPFFVPDTRPVERNPVILYYSDGFQKPYPFEPTMVVGLDQPAAEKKWACISAMPSQFGDADSWQARTRPGVPAGDAERAAFLLEGVKQRGAAVADQYRERLSELHGAVVSRGVEFAEAFELSEYGRQVSVEELKAMMPAQTGR